MVEYWKSRVFGTYIVAIDGEVQLSGKRYVKEYYRIKDLLKDYPTAKYCREMT